MDDASEIFKSGAASHIAELLSKLAGPAFEEVGIMIGNQARVYRVKNAIKTAEKTKRILKDAGLNPGPVPTRLLLPILDACSVEDNNDLQERWAALLASASQEADLSPSFIETLKQLTPEEAKHFDRIFKRLSLYFKRPPVDSDSIPYVEFTTATRAPSAARETYERLGLIWREYAVKFEKPRLLYPTDSEGSEDSQSMLSDLDDALSNLEAGVVYEYHLTEYALRFLKACHGPLKETISMGLPSDEEQH